MALTCISRSHKRSGTDGKTVISGLIMFELSPLMVNVLNKQGGIGC